MSLLLRGGKGRGREEGGEDERGGGEGREGGHWIIVLEDCRLRTLAGTHQQPRSGSEEAVTADAHHTISVLSALSWNRLERIQLDTLSTAREMSVNRLDRSHKFGCRQHTGAAADRARRQSAPGRLSR